MRYTYDPCANAVYLDIRPGTVAKTIQVHDSLMIDVDNFGWVLGIEVLCPTPELLRALAEVKGTHKTIPTISLKG